MPTFHEYMRAYADDHRHPINRKCHMIGIPLIVASLPVIPANPPVGVGMFGVGWTFQFVGHTFERKRPSFLRDWRYLLVGPLWAANEWVEALTGAHLYTPPSDPAPAHTNGAATAP